MKSDYTVPHPVEHINWFEFTWFMIKMYPNATMKKLVKKTKATIMEMYHMDASQLMDMDDRIKSKLEFGRSLFIEEHKIN